MRAGKVNKLVFQSLLGSLMLVLVAVSAHAGAATLPATGEEMVGEIRKAIETRNYERIAELIYWEGAGKIKKRVVRFRVRAALGRPIRDIALIDFQKEKLDDDKSINGRLRLNMPVSHQVRVTYDEPISPRTGRTPTTVFMIGERDNAMRIALVVRNYKDDDGD